MSSLPHQSSENIAFEINDLSAGYHDRAVLKNLNLVLPEGETLALLGTNGAGKSTLLKVCMGLLPQITGSVNFFGAPLGRVRSRVGYMPQVAEVDWDFPTTVLDTVLMGTYAKLGWLKNPGSKEKKLAHAALEMVGIEDLAHRQISELSGGQKQRCFVARILAQNPDIYLMDEPFAGVDASSEKAIIGVLNQLRAAGKTIVVVHHDLSTVRSFCSWVALLAEGKVIETGPVDKAFKAETVSRAYGIDSSFFECEADCECPVENCILNSASSFKN